MSAISALFLALAMCSAVSAGELIITPTSLAFTVVQGQRSGGTVDVNSSDGSAITFDVSASSSNAWLTVIGSQVTGVFFSWQSTTPTSISVFVDASNLPAGSYPGTINIVAGEQSPSVPVSLTVQSAPSLSVTPSSLTLQASTQSTTVLAESLSITLAGNSTTGLYSYTAAANGGNWLSIGAPAGAVPSSLAVYANPSGLAAGVYSGSIVVSVIGTSNSLVTIPITLTVSLPPPLLSVVPNSLSFSFQQGGNAPSPQLISVSSMNIDTLQFTVASDQSWLTVSPTNGGTTANVSVAVAAGALDPGQHKGTLTFTASGASNSPQIVPVELSIIGPSATITSLVNAASYSTAAPGGAATLFGTFPDLPTASASLPLPMNLGGVAITVDGYLAPLYYVSPAQINLQIPWEASGNSNPEIVASNASWSVSYQAQLATVSPGIFELNPDHQGAILHADYSLVTASHPAVSGEIVLIYATGLGPVSILQHDGTPASFSDLATTVTQPQIQMGGQFATLQWAGLAPGFVGLYQVNAVVPENLSGNPSVVLSANGDASNPATMAVK
jgi:adhesin/invasin